MMPESYEVAIIGAGVCGANIARRLSAYEIDVALLDKEADVSFGVSKANSGIVHGGFHHNKKYLKARLEIQGAMMFDRLKSELGFPFVRCGIVVVALHEDEMRAVEQLYAQGVDNGAIGIEMCSRERMLELEPKLSRGRPRRPLRPGRRHRRAISLRIFPRRVRGQERRPRIHGMECRRGRARGRCLAPSRGGRADELRASYAVNCAGLSADEVSRMFGAEDYSIKGRKGEYYLLDKLTKAKPDRVVFPVPTSVSKGMLVVPTVEGTVLIGPTAERGRGQRGRGHDRSAARDHLAERAEYDSRHLRSRRHHELCGYQTHSGRGLLHRPVRQGAGIQSRSPAFSLPASPRARR